ncbi:hypothetical protein VaNZ11_000198 [Volvox africanus]|uniref:C2H2-type domain-containing protein n=1 Tax=Volvox africanus TaxID=51714 RepID=A0ABQ5RM93_9CHLO|nr:hypothetical protein VaNZ11_000198 [Volvox africanus]
MIMLVYRPMCPKVRKAYFWPSRCVLRIVRATSRERAEVRAFQRFLKNRIKQLGTLLPPCPDAPEPDAALLWGFLSRQLAEGISNEAELLPRAEVVSRGLGHRRGAAEAQSAKASRRGVVISQPQPLPADARRTVPCHMPSWAPAVTDGTPGSSGDVASQATLVHVIWDVESAHPGDRDPRLVAVEVLRLARRLGRVVGSYAYGTRQAWAWVPTYFVSTYVLDTDDARDGSADSYSSGGGAAGMVALPPTPGRVRCPLCGKLLAAARLERHLQTLHPDKPARSLAVAAITKSNLQELAEPPPAGASARAGRGSLKKNLYHTGLGAVREYYSSGGELFRPPAGHQLGLKYVLQREGFEPRVAQNADDASDRALNGGVDRLLAALRAGTVRAAADGRTDGRGLPLPAELPYTLMLVSGSRRHAAALTSCRRLGVRTVVVAAGPGVVEEVGQADLLLDWELLAGGAYQT